MSRLHCALNTNNFEASVDFYTKLFGLLPVRLEDGYAKFSSNDLPPGNKNVDVIDEREHNMFMFEKMSIPYISLMDLTKNE